MWFILFLLLFAKSLISYDRVVLVEIFTSTTCSYCPAAEAAVDNVVNANPLRVVEIAYHVWWPAPGNDPFYLANQNENRARVNYYAVDGTPTIFVDGTETGSSNLSSYVSSRLSVSSPLQINLSFPSTNRVRAVIRSTTTLSGNIRAFFVITESNIHYSAPNGRNIFNGVMRDIIPDTNGVPITISSTDSVVLEYPYTINSSWDLSNLKMVFFVQNRETKVVYQSAVESIPVGGHYFILNSLSPTRALVDPFSSTPFEFVAVLRNIGTEPDSYRVRLIKSIPEEWSASLCISTRCFGDSAKVGLSPSASESLKIELYTLGFEGTGRFKIIVQSLFDSTLKDSVEYMATTGGGVLIVDDDQGDNFERYYEAALESLMIQYFTLSRLDGPINSSTLMRFRAVIWFTGTPYTDVLNSVDRVALQTYLTNGGNLFLTGAEIGWYLTDTSSFYRNYLHAHYVADSAWNYNVYGIAGDPISDGISFRISGGDGANNQRYPDVILPRSSYATPIFTYGTSLDSCAGLRINTGTYKVVYLGFGFEAINNFPSRLLLMQRVMNYLGISSSTESGSVDFLPKGFVIRDPYPNPFNSACNIKFYVGSAGKVKFEIVNLVGEKIASYEQEYQKGEHMFQVSSEKLISSGIYFVKASYNGQTKGVRVVFLK